MRSRVGTGAPSPTSTSKNLVSIAKQLEQDELWLNKKKKDLQRQQSN